MYNAHKKKKVQPPVHNQVKSLKMTSHKAESKPKKTKKSKGKKEGASKSSFSLFSPRALQIYGIVLMAFSLFLIVSLVSNFFHHTADISYVTSSTEPGNAAGPIGAHLAYFFVDGCMGVFSVGFAFLFFLYGVRLTFGKSLLPLFKTSVATILVMAWFSILFGLFCANTDAEFLSGSFGNYLSELLHANVGWAISILVMIVFLFVILILCFGFSMNTLLKVKLPHHQRDNEEKPARKALFGRKNRRDEEDDDVQFEPQNEDTKLSDLYITNKNELSDEYRGNVFTFDEPKQTSPAPADNEVVPASQPEFNDIFANKMAVTKPDKPKYEEVPFEVKIATGQPAENEQAEDQTDLSELDEGDIVENEEVAESEEQLPTEPLEDYDPRKDLSFYQFPTLDLLNDYPAKEANEEQMRRELTEKKVRIEQTLSNFGISIKNITATVGPTVTLYEIVPAEGVRISKIKNLEDDIALSLAALGIRIIAPIPGRGTIGIEVPNKSPNIVSMKDVLASDKFKNNKFELPIALGKTISNEPFVVDLSKMPHLLMAGATGQGKSVGLNAIITSLLYTKHPSELKFVLVDPKKVEFTLYSAIENHYLAKLPEEEEAIITDPKKVVRTLNSLCVEMDQRYDLLKLAKTRNIKEYNAKFCSRKLSPALGHRYLPYIVLIIDEFGDLIMTAGREVELPIARLAQLARAIGIHLVIATQRPSVNIITGMIKANFPSRIAFRVTSVVDSRTILDGSGANQLIGKGDMLISTGSDLIRLQCAFVDTPEVERIANFIEEQQAYPEAFLLPYVPDTDSNDKMGDEDDGPLNSDEIDSYFVEAAKLIVQSQQGSTSSIQRKLKLGYNRAGRIMDQLEEFGVVGPAERSGKPREVKVKTQEELQLIFQKMGLF